MAEDGYQAYMHLPKEDRDALKQQAAFELQAKGDGPSYGWEFRVNALAYELALKKTQRTDPEKNGTKNASCSRCGRPTEVTQVVLGKTRTHPCACRCEIERYEQATLRGKAKRAAEKPERP